MQNIITEAVSCKEGEWPEYKREWLKARSAGHLHKYLQYGA